MKFCDTEAAFWQMALQHSQLHSAHSGSSHPHLGACAVAGLASRCWEGSPNARIPAHTLAAAALTRSGPLTVVFAGVQKP
jgi:hypothetical protein